MPSVLDNRKTIERCDPKDMLGAVERFPEYMISQLQDYSRRGTRFPHSELGSLVFMGMGGSASAGDLILDWLGNRISVPAIVQRDTVLPRFVGSGTLFVALSYSGDTSETLTAFREARRRGSSLVAIGTGGKLRKLSEGWNVPFLEVGSAPAPRAALGQMVVASAATLNNCGLVNDQKSEIELAAQELRQLSRKIQRQVDLDGNPAKRLALSLKSRLPTVFAFRRMASVARRFKNQLAENSKVFAKYSLLPEAAHNEIEAWHNQRFPLVPVFVRDHSESDLERDMLQRFRSTITTAGQIAPEQVRLKAQTRLGSLLSPILYLDFVSVYLAILRGIDPAGTPWIERYKARI